MQCANSAGARAQPGSLCLCSPLAPTLQLEEADRAASKQARLCSLRLSYLEQVEKLAQQSKSGPVDFERMADEEEGDPAVAVGSIPPTAAAAGSAKTKSRSTRNASEMDTDSAEAAVAGSLALAASASSSAAAAAATASSSESADSRAFTVTPQMRLDRIFADHLLRNSQ